jgi:hypothetical protein
MDFGDAAVLAPIERAGKLLTAQSAPPTTTPAEDIVIAELKASVDATGDEARIAFATHSMLVRFTRGCYTSLFRNVTPEAERIARCVDQLALALDFSIDEVDAPSLPTRRLQRADEWEQLWPVTITGSSAEGLPIVWQRMPRDAIMATFADTAEALSYRAQQSERALDFLRRSSAARGELRYQAVWVTDAQAERGSAIGAAKLRWAQECSMWQPRRPPRGAAADSSAKRPRVFVDQYLYQECLAKFIVVRAPWYVRGVWGVMRRLIEPSTASKVVILGDSADIPALLAAHGVAADRVPRYLGGSAADPPGMLRQLSVAAGQRAEVLLPVVVEAEGAAPVSWSRRGCAAAGGASVPALEWTIELAAHTLEVSVDVALLDAQGAVAIDASGAPCVEALFGATLGAAPTNAAAQRYDAATVRAWRARLCARAALDPAAAPRELAIRFAFDNSASWLRAKSAEWCVHLPDDVVVRPL